MTDDREHTDPGAFLRSHMTAARRNPRTAWGLVLFSVMMAVGIWFGTLMLDVWLRVFCVVLGVVTIVGCGAGYLFDDDE